MDLVNQVLDWSQRVSGALSIVSFIVAVWAALGVRRINNAWRNLVRIQELQSELTGTASKISSAAPNVANDREALLGYFSDAEAILTSLKGSIGGRFLFGSRRRALILDIEKVRATLNQYREKNNLDSATTREAYRQISQVALRIEHHVQDRRLER
jgi:hypothetical protein